MDNDSEANVHTLEDKIASDNWALGPGSITWQIMQDPVVFQIGQLRTATLLLLHPPFAASAEHDTFMINPLLRFRRVGVYAYTATYGTRRDAEKMSHMVRTRHGQVTGIEPVTRRPYQSHSEYELALTHVIQASSYLAIFEAINGVLPEADRDQYYQEQKVPSAMLGIAPEHLPSTNVEAQAFLAEARKRYAVGEAGRDLLAYYDNKPYAPGTALGDLPFLKRNLALWSVRAVVDIAILTLDEKDKLILSINRRPKLRWRWAVKLSLKFLSSFMRSKRGQKMWEFYLQKRTFDIYQNALAIDNSEGHETRKSEFVVPDPDDCFFELPDLKRNWPGDVADYAVGREIEGKVVLEDRPFVNLRDPSKSLEEAMAS